MIEVTLRNYLQTELNLLTDYTTTPVLMEQPQTVPDEYVLLRLIDGGQVNKIDAATFVVATRSSSMYKAAQLRDAVKTILLNATDLDAISSAKLGGERIATDTTNHIYQYELTFNFYYYEEET